MGGYKSSRAGDVKMFAWSATKEWCSRKESTFVRDLNLKPPPLGGRAEG